MGDEAFRELSQMDPSAGDLITKVGATIVFVPRSPASRHLQCSKAAEIGVGSRKRGCSTVALTFHVVSSTPHTSGRYTPHPMCHKQLNFVPKMHRYIH